MLGSVGHAKDAGKIPCVICGKLFRPKVANQLTCSEKCKKINKANRDKARKARIRKSVKDSLAAAKKIACPAPVKKGDKFKANGKKFVCVKGGKKPVAKVVKGKAVEKIVLPKKPTVKKLPKNPKIDTLITVKNGNPFKVFFLATLIREKAKREILTKGLVYGG